MFDGNVAENDRQRQGQQAAGYYQGAAINAALAAALGTVGWRGMGQYQVPQPSVCWPPLLVLCGCCMQLCFN